MKKIVLLTLLAKGIKDEALRAWYINWLKTGYEQKDAETLILIDEVLHEQ